MSPSSDFYQSHLDRVSRSFAFCIAQLADPLRGWVGLSYLLCRIVDTIEDSPWLIKEEQMKAFALFDQALLKGDPVDGWTALFPQDINGHERALLTDAPRMFKELHALDPAIRDSIIQMVHSMSLGMQHFARKSPAGQLRLTNLGEVNQYCFFVAGLVGELLAKLLARVDASFNADQATVLRAHHFGLFLQKVNLLKDQTADQKSGRHLIPSRDLVERSARENAFEAFAFLKSLPVDQTEFRRFCAWSLFLGLESIAVARDSAAAMRVLKVSRDHTAAIIARVEQSLNDQTILEEMFAEARERLGWTGSAAAVALSPLLPEWLLKLYHGGLQPQALMQLGVASPTTI